MLLSNQSHTQPTDSTCTYCGHRTAVSPDLKSYICSECGVQQQAGSVDPVKQMECPYCHAHIPIQAIYCVHCNEILKLDLLEWMDRGGHDFVHDLNWRAGKSSSGHLVFAKALLKSLNTILSKGDDTKEMKYSPFDILYESMISYEVAVNDAESIDACAGFLPELDRIYGNIINWALSVLQDSQSVSRSAQLAQEIRAKSNYLVARQRVETVFGDKLQTYGSIGLWCTNLIEWVQTQNSQYRMKNYNKLKEEVIRFNEWMALHPKPARNYRDTMTSN